MSKKKHNLDVVALSDKKTLFFAGAFLSLKSKPWHLVCVTDGNADGQGAKRKLQFEAACKKLNVKNIVYFGMPDRYTSRLDLVSLKNKLSSLASPHLVFTHGPIGEYAHPHHQDVSLAVHEFYNKKCAVWGVAHNCEPDKVIHLSTKQFKIKTEILSKIYFSETERFINFVPATFSEGYAKFSIEEVRALYSYFAKNDTSQFSHLKKYKWFIPYLTSLRARIENRPF